MQFFISNNYYIHLNRYFEKCVNNDFQYVLEDSCFNKSITQQLYTHLVEWNGLKHPEFVSLDVETEEVHRELVERQEDGVQWETLHRHLVLQPTTTFIAILLLQPFKTFVMDSQICIQVEVSKTFILLKHISFTDDPPDRFTQFFTFLTL